MLAFAFYSNENMRMLKTCQTTKRIVYNRTLGQFSSELKFLCKFSRKIYVRRNIEMSVLV